MCDRVVDSPGWEVRFWSKVAIGDESECWPWLASLGTTGYGQFNLGRPIGAHRVAYELLRGPIPTGLVIDHLCRNRRCVNPWHLEAVTHAVNLLRGDGASGRNARATVCRRGHPLSGENLRWDHRGARVCLSCERRRSREKYRRDRGLARV